MNPPDWQVTDYSEDETPFVTAGSGNGDRAELRALIEERTRQVEAKIRRQQRLMKAATWLAITSSLAGGLYYWLYASRPASRQEIPTISSPSASSLNSGAVAPASTSFAVENPSGATLRSSGTELMAPLQLRVATEEEDLRLLEERFEKRGVPPRVPRRVLEWIEQQEATGAQPGESQ